MTDQALSGVKIVDLSWHVAGPYCTKLLANLGADVVKVERPGKGDPSRWEGPFPNDVVDPERSGLFAYLNTDKLGITLNLKSEGGASVLNDLVKWADVLVENFSPRVLPGLGFGYETVKQWNPALVMASITNFGQTTTHGNWRANDFICQAMSGLMGMRGDMARSPLRGYGELGFAEYMAGAIAADAIIPPLIAEDGQGIHLDLSITEVAYGMGPMFPMMEKIPGSEKVRSRFIMTPAVEPCKDGFVGLTTVTAEEWKRLCLMMQMDDWAENMDFVLGNNRYQRRTEVRARMHKWLKDRTIAEVFKASQHCRVPLCFVPTTKDLLESPHYAERGYFVKVDHPRLGETIQPGSAYRMSETPWRIRRPAPLLGQHNEEVLGGLLGYDAAKVRQLSVDGAF